MDLRLVNEILLTWLLVPSSRLLVQLHHIFQLTDLLHHFFSFRAGDGNKVIRIFDAQLVTVCVTCDACDGVDVDNIGPVTTDRKRVVKLTFEILQIRAKQFFLNLIFLNPVYRSVVIISLNKKQVRKVQF
jgi:hypothetical protein